MATNIKNFIIEQLKSANPAMDTRPGSVLRDLLVNPLALVLEGYQQDHKRMLERQTVSNIGSLSEDELDAVASNFLISRNKGTKSTGYVRLYFSSPKAFTIPKGARFKTADGILFETTYAFTVSRLQMEQNTLDYPNYDTGQVPVQSVLEGANTNIPANSSFTSTGSLPSSPIKINNTGAFYGGIEKETNDKLYNRLVDAVNNKSLAAPTAIKSGIKDLISSVVDVDVIGAGHPLMVRDLTNLAETVANYKSHDFTYTYSGLHSGDYDKKHMALTGHFIDIDPTADVSYPEVSGWSKEFSNDMYQGLYNKTDLSYAEDSSKIIVREYFEDLLDNEAPQQDLAYLATSGGWQFHDGVNGNNQMFYLDEISVSNNKLRLGKTLDPTSVDATLQIPLAMLSGIYDLAGSAIQGTTEEAINQLEDLIQPSNFNNTSPIFHKQIDQHLGVKLQCEISTTDGTENGEMCYITFLRNSEKYLPHDGYGLGWRKQPSFLIRINNNTHTSEDIAQFVEEYGVTEEVALGLVGQLSNSVNKKYWKYNIYLVDNDILQEEVWIGHDMLWDQTSGRNQFLQAAKTWIEPNETYNVKMKLFPQLAFQCWIWNNGVTFDDTTHQVLDRGQTYPPYVPVSGDVKTYTSGLESLDANRSHFGIAVAQTRNYIWSFDDLVINSFVETFPMHLFRFKVDSTYFNPGKDATFSYHGVGYDPLEYAIDNNTGNSKVKVGVYNEAMGAWQDLGSHESTIDSDRATQKIQKTISPLGNYLDSEGFVNFAATPANSGPGFEDNVEHSLRTYHCEINNTAMGGIHRGNAVDIYVHDPQNTAVGSAVMTMDSSVLNVWTMPGVSSYIQEILEVREFTSQLSLDKSTWSLSYLSDGNTYGAMSQPQITFDLDNMSGTIIEVVYRHLTSGTSIASYLSNPDTRYPAADQMVKVMPPARIKINGLKYAGGIDEVNMRQAIATYFNTLEDTSFDKSDLVNLLYANGASFVDLDMLIFIYQYNTEGVQQIIPMTAQTYKIPITTIARFFCSEGDLLGVERV